MRLRLMAVAMRYEWRQLRREAATWFVAVALLASAGFALSVGSRHVTGQSATATIARTEEAQRLSALKKTLVELQTAPPKEPSSRYFTPR